MTDYLRYDDATRIVVAVTTDSDAPQGESIIEKPENFEFHGQWTVVNADGTSSAASQELIDQFMDVRMPIRVIVRNLMASIDALYASPSDPDLMKDLLSTLKSYLQASFS